MNGTDKYKVVNVMTRIGLGCITALFPSKLCVWRDGAIKCKGRVSIIYMFSGQIEAPVCKEHSRGHLKISKDYKYGIKNIIDS